MSTNKYDRDAAMQLLGETAKFMSEIEGCGDHARVQFLAGSNISSCAAAAIVAAEILGMPVHFKFNSVELEAKIGDEPSELVDHYMATLDAEAEAYRESPEGKSAAAKREREINEKQRQVEQLQRQLPTISDDHDLLVSWIAEFSVVNDDIAIKIDTDTIRSALTEAGYKRNDCVGDEEVKTDKAKMARYLAGQALDGIDGPVGKMHPLLAHFAEQYQAMESGPARQSA